MQKKTMAILILILSVAGVIYAAPQEHFSSKSFSENSEYNHALIAELTSSVTENREMLVEIKSSLLDLAANIEQTPDHTSDLINMADSLEAVQEKQTETMNLLAATSERIDSLDARDDALADKLDAEDVTNLDTDYRATIDAL